MYAIAPLASQGYDVVYMKQQMLTVDQWLQKAFSPLPRLPKSSRDALVNLWPTLAVVFGCIQIIAAWALWSLLRTSDVVLKEYSSYYIDYKDGVIGQARTLAFVAICILLVNSVLLFMAYSRLKARKKAGWKLLRLGIGLNLLYALLSMFVRDEPVLRLFITFLGTLVGLYLLYEVRSFYKK